MLFWHRISAGCNKLSEFSSKFEKYNNQREREREKKRASARWCAFRTSKAVRLFSSFFFARTRVLILVFFSCRVYAYKYLLYIYIKVCVFNFLYYKKILLIQPAFFSLKRPCNIYCRTSVITNKCGDNRYFLINIFLSKKKC